MYTIAFEARIRLRLIAFGILTLFVCAPGAMADVRLPRLLSDGLILQRDIPANLWGWADDGETVRVFLDDALAGTAEAVNGRWRLQLPANPAGGPHQLKFEGDNSLAVEDVWFGDIWIASGQSNMELPMERVQDRYAAEIAAADLPRVRQFKVPKDYDFEFPHEDVDGAGWVASTPDTVGEFSAVAWFFARALEARYEVPIGIINSSFGGSPAEGWLSEQELEAWPEYLAIAKSYREEGYLAGLRAADQADADAWYGNLGQADSGLNADPPWSAMDVDDTEWELMEVPGNWAGTDLGPVHGSVWFRKTIDLPDSVEGQPALLNLGRIVDADTTWINGVEVGATTYQYPPRRYEIPAGVLKSGANTIAVRVVNVGGEGGFVTDKPYWLKSGSQSFSLEGDWRYHLGAAAEAIPPMRFQEWRQPLGYYNAMLSPLQKMTIKGVIWYQGESNVGRAKEYEQMFPAMIRAWRRQWGQGDFPFLFVQLANFLEASDTPVDSQWAELRDAQKAALSEPATAMAVTIDVGEWNDIHPLNKQAVGERLALAARRVAYGEQDVVFSGPMLDSVVAEDGALVLSFSHTGGGLEARGGPLQEFAVAGPDGRYVRADAQIRDGEIVVRSDAVPDPVWVRYAWADNPAQANLYNREGLPASPFQAHLADPLHVARILIEALLSRDDYMMYQSDDFTGLHYAAVRVPGRGPPFRR